MIARAWSRVGIPIAVSLGVGLICSVVVAWGFALYGKSSVGSAGTISVRTFSASNLPGQVHFCQSSHRGIIQRAIWVSAAGDEQSMGLERAGRFMADLSENQFVYWVNDSRVREAMWPWCVPLPSRPHDADYGYAVLASGWPLPCMRAYAYVKDPSSSWDMRWIFDADEAPVAAQDFPLVRGVPLQPLWRGLLIDSSLYACVPLAGFGIHLAYKRLLRRSRRRRGLCAYCAYPRGANGSRVCVECGRECFQAEEELGRDARSTAPDSLRPGAECAASIEIEPDR